jgi:tRNA-dihydrouridine synthase
VLQLGVADSQIAVRAAQVVARDVRAIDINLGCPQHFSVQGGMGAALLAHPDRVRDIVQALRRNVPSTLPVTCKIRIYDTVPKTVELMRRLEHCGVAAIAVHARRISDRPRHVALPELIQPLVHSVTAVPVIYNGDVFRPADFDKYQRLTHATGGVMVARGAQWNCSVFRSAGMLPIYDVARRYVELAQHYNAPLNNCKYAVQQMLVPLVKKLPCFQAFGRCKSYAAIGALFPAQFAKARALTAASVPPPMQTVPRLAEHSGDGSHALYVQSMMQRAAGSKKKRKKKDWQKQQEKLNRSDVEAALSSAPDAAAAAASATSSSSSAVGAADDSVAPPAAKKQKLLHRAESKQ